MSQTLDKILGKKVKAVEVLGEKISLAPPAYAESMAIREELKKVTSGKKMTNEASFDFNLKVNAMCILACVTPKLDDLEEAKHLFIIAGGDYGELAREAADLCGVMVAANLEDVKRKAKGAVNEDLIVP